MKAPGWRPTQASPHVFPTGTAGDTLPVMDPAPPPIAVNRAPVLTLWAPIVAERLGYPSDTALTLGRAVCSASARTKARRLGIADEAREPAERRAAAAGLKPRVLTIRLLGREVPVIAAADGSLRADDNGKLPSAKSVQTYITRAFGDRLPEVRSTIEAVAASLAPEELNRVGFRLYEKFRPDVPDGAQGWGAKGELRVERIRGRDGVIVPSTSIFTSDHVGYSGPVAAVPVETAPARNGV